ncbi:hypothetical protein MRX96_028654 [Rhipicephalus microplus]
MHSENGAVPDHRNESSQPCCDGGAVRHAAMSTMTSQGRPSTREAVEKNKKRVAHSKVVYSNNAEYYYYCGALVAGNIADPICG